MGEYPRIDTPWGRAYVLEPGRIAPSVTSVLRGTTDDTSLKSWQKRVGKKEAQRRADEGSKRGNALHAAMESWAETKSPTAGEGPWWESMKSALPRIAEALAPEQAVASRQPGVEYCGTVDLFASWITERYGTRRAVLDYKSSNRPKDRKYLIDYKLQLAAYLDSDEAKEMGMEIGVLIVTSPDNPAQIVELVGPALDAAFNGWVRRLTWYHSGVAGAWGRVQEACDGLY